MLQMDLQVFLDLKILEDLVFLMHFGGSSSEKQTLQGVMI